MSQRSRVLVTALFVLGTLLVQAAWLLVVPPFEGMDEFDHAHHATAVAHGELVTDLGPAPQGRGLLVTADGSVVDAARIVCESFSFTEPDNCVPTERGGDGLVTIASASAIYAPTYYLGIGWPSRFLEGYAALLGMRLLSALLCLLVVGLACWLVTGWSRTGAPLAALVLTLTPTAAYSLVVVAPNGLEIGAALVLWAALIGLFVRRTDPAMRESPPAQADTSRLIAIATVAAVLMCWLRPFGPIWVFLILVAWLVLLGARPFVALVRDHPRAMGSGILVMAAGAASAAWWVVSHPSVDEGRPPTDNPNRVTETLEQIPLWFFQSIAQVPYRDVASPPIVYVLGVAALGVVVVSGLRAGGRYAQSIACVMLTAIAVSAWYTWSRLPTSGLLWQGRYSWCLAVGAVLVAGLVMERRRFPLVMRIGAPLGALCVVVCQVIALVAVLDFEVDTSVLYGDPAWHDPATWLVVALGAAGTTAWIAACWFAHRPATSEREVRA